MFDRRVGLGDPFAAIGAVFGVGGQIASSWISSDAQRSIAKEQSRTDFVTAQAQARLQETQARLETERAATQDAAITTWVLYGAGTLGLLGVLALILRRH